ncbi:leucine-rich repeat domain-containing protein [Psychrobacter sp. ANT_H56B]|uniref:leucine-rich repeat domain-containing protein n=1 Tax=Psychrobacter sp. ANT_H56B TaxID=2597353 RepID=UPI0011F3C580|nr:leucine-rich repeat domain-containing protein [Psychrobacter sp. ANT_H56B]KAA0926894.1 leucine-rich repeat domain-containing protein [Psychrobacter sp. ANT_H56B]
MSELNSKVGNNAIEPWLTELWAWADKVAIPDEVLPRDHATLLALTDLSIDCSQLTKLPESIGYLYNLTKLTLNCESLERLPESVGQLNELEELTVNSHKVQEFPDSIANLENLRLIDVPNQLISRLPTAVIERYRNNELWIKNITFTKLYTAQISEYDLAAFVFFLVNDDWDENKLIDLKQKTAPEFLFGLQTTEKTIKQFDVVDGIIICKPDEVQQVMKMFKDTFCNEFTAIPYTDVEEALSFAKPAKFIQASALGMSKSDQVLSQIINQIPEDITINSMMFQAESNREFTLDNFQIVVDAFGKMGIKDEHTFYNTEVVDKTEYCWMGMIYMVS